MTPCHRSKLGSVLLASLCASTLALPLTSIAADPDYNTPSSSSGSYVKDSYITAKVKAALARDKDVTARNIKVETDGKGMVYLSGQAQSQAEADKAVADARAVEGVTSVTSSIQVR